VELIVQPDAKDVVGEMAMGGDWSRSRGGGGDIAGGDYSYRGSRSSGVERAKVHVKVLYSVGPTGN
jgi:hypothetical protein